MPETRQRSSRIAAPACTATIHAITTVAVRRDGGTWHRVLVGPFESRRTARAAQLALLREDIDSLVLRSEP